MSDSFWAEHVRNANSKTYGVSRDITRGRLAVVYHCQEML